MDQLTQLRNDILREMYNHAEPSLDFDAVLDDPEAYPDDWYAYHYLPADDQHEIFDIYTENVSLTGAEHARLVTECFTLLGPTASKELRDEKQNS